MKFPPCKYNSYKYQRVLDIVKVKKFMQRNFSHVSRLFQSQCLIVEEDASVVSEEKIPFDYSLIGLSSDREKRKRSPLFKQAHLSYVKPQTGKRKRVSFVEKKPESECGDEICCESTTAVIDSNSSTCLLYTSPSPRDRG